MDAPVSWQRDVSPAAWLVERLHPFAEDVGSVVPEGYEAYARVFHPVVGPNGERRRWSDTAASNGRIVHAEMQLHMIDRPVGTRAASGYREGDGYDSGSLPALEREALVELLRPRHVHTGPVLVLRVGGLRWARRPRDRRAR